MQEADAALALCTPLRTVLSYERLQQALSRDPAFRFPNISVDRIRDKIKSRISLQGDCDYQDVFVYLTMHGIHVFTLNEFELLPSSTPFGGRNLWFQTAIKIYSRVQIVIVAIFQVSFHRRRDS